MAERKDFCGVFLFKAEKGKLYVMLLPPHNGRRGYKAPGGMREDGERIPEATLRECQEELEVSPTNLRFVCEEEDSGTPNLWRSFSVATRYEGEPREDPKLDNDEVIPPPEWVEVTKELVFRFGNGPFLVYSHQEGFCQSVVEGSRMEFEIYEAAKAASVI